VEIYICIACYEENNKIVLLTEVYMLNDEMNFNLVFEDEKSFEKLKNEIKQDEIKTVTICENVNGVKRCLNKKQVRQSFVVKIVLSMQKILRTKYTKENLLMIKILNSQQVISKF